MKASAMNLVPRRLSGPVARRVREHVGDAPALVTDTACTAQLQQVSAAMDAANQAVTSNTSCVAETDVTTWSGIYAAWKTWRDGLQSCLGHWAPSVWSDCTNTYGYSFTGEWAAASAKLTAQAGIAAQWQAKVAAACPGYTPPPPPPPPPPPGNNPPPASGSWWDSLFGGGGGSSTTSDVAGAIKWVAIAAIVVVIGVEVWPVMAPAIMAALPRKKE